MKTVSNILITLLIFWVGCVSGQVTIPLVNPSFEADQASAGVVPSGWINLGATDQTPPDIQPGWFGVEMKAQEGDTYLGLCVRENNTWEGVGQKLRGLLEKDSVYTFSIWLSRSNTYQSATSKSTALVNFNSPTVLKIWGYNTETKQEELLGESEPVSHSKWIQYEFMLSPKLADFDEIDLMAYYAPGQEQKNGNLLIDNCSAIKKLNK